MGIPVLHVENQRTLLAPIIEADAAVQSQVVEKIEISLIVVLVVLVDGIGKIDIRRLRRGGLHVDHAAYVVVILHHGATCSTHLHTASLIGLILLRDGQATILDKGEQRHQLEGRAGLDATRECIVLLLVIYAAALGRLAQIDHSQNVARSHLHDHRRAPDSLLVDHLTAQCRIGCMLNLDIERSHNIISVRCHKARIAVYRSGESRSDALTQ